MKGKQKCKRVDARQFPKKNDSKTRELFRQLRGGNKDVLQSLITDGADVNARNEDGWTPLAVAAFYENSEAVKALLANGADPSAKMDGSWTASAWTEVEGSCCLRTSKLLRKAEGRARKSARAKTSFCRLKMG
ncbi:MAG: ankyrin repeat domain-containing protein [Alphaproteobacteria bacterium]|nr:ankyrin repeat domain-containing protein [Alphaproteobacteria bacterium]